MFRISKLVIEGIKSYYGKNIFLFEPNDRLIIVSGSNKENNNLSNGTGKSTIFNQIVYGLGLYSRIPKNIVNNKRKEGLIEIDLINERTNTKYKIRRKLYKANSRQSDLEVFKNGMELTFQRNDSFPEFLSKEILGMDVELFRKLRIFSPESEMLLQVGGSELVRFLEKIIEIDKFDLYYSQQSDIIQKYTEEINKYNILIENEKKEIDKIKKNEFTNENIQYIENKITALEKEMNEINYDENREKELNNQKNEYLKREHQLNKQITTFEQNIKSSKKEIKRLEDLKKENRCPVCFTKIENNPQVITEIDKVIEQNNKIIEENTKLIEITKKELEEVKLKVKELDDELKKVMENRIKKERVMKQIKDMEKVKNEILANLKKQMNSNIEERMKKIKEYENEINSLNEKRDIYKQLTQILSPKSLFRQKILNDLLLVQLKEYMEYYSQFLLSNEKVSFYYENNKLYIGLEDIRGNFKEYSMLSSGERKKCEIIFLLSLNELLIMMGKNNFNLFIFDEIFDNLDSYSSVQLMEMINEFTHKLNQFFMVTTHKNVFDIQNSTIIKVERGFEKKIKTNISYLKEIIRI